MWRAGAGGACGHRCGAAKILAKHDVGRRRSSRWLNRPRRRCRRRRSVTIRPASLERPCPPPSARPPTPRRATACSAVLSSAPLQSRLLQQAGQKKYKGRHSFADFLPSTVE